MELDHMINEVRVVRPNDLVGRSVEGVGDEVSIVGSAVRVLDGDGTRVTWQATEGALVGYVVEPTGALVVRQQGRDQPLRRYGPAGWIWVDGPELTTTTP